MTLHIKKPLITDDFLFISKMERDRIFSQVVSTLAQAPDIIGIIDISNPKYNPPYSDIDLIIITKDTVHNKSALLLDAMSSQSNYLFKHKFFLVPESLVKQLLNNAVILHVKENSQHFLHKVYIKSGYKFPKIQVDKLQELLGIIEYLFISELYIYYRISKYKKIDYRTLYKSIKNTIKDTIIISRYFLFQNNHAAACELKKLHYRIHYKLCMSTKMSHFDLWQTYLSSLVANQTLIKKILSLNKLSKIHPKSNSHRSFLFVDSKWGKIAFTNYAFNPVSFILHLFPPKILMDMCIYDYLQSLLSCTINTQHSSSCVNKRMLLYRMWSLYLRRNSLQDIAAPPVIYHFLSEIL